MQEDRSKYNPDRATVRDPAGGANQIVVRDHNERLVLSMIQRHGKLASADVARRSGLSAQTVSVIIRALERDGLLIRGDPVRGNVGKPSVPISLNPSGAYAYGLKIGRRSSDLLLLDFTGSVRQRVSQTYAYPTPGKVMAFVRKGYAQLTAARSAIPAARVSGIGIAAPYQLWKWLDSANAPEAQMSAWKGFDLAGEIGAATGLTALLANDATCACAAEHFLGRGRELADFAYFFIGSFIGGGVVLNHAVYAGRTSNAGAFGTLPVRDTSKPDHQLIQNASIYRLEQRLAAAGRDAAPLWEDDGDWSGFDRELDDWIVETARYLAVATVAVSSVIDFEAILIEGLFPRAIRTRLVNETTRRLADVDTQGIELPHILEATIGADAKATGAGCLPIFSQYFFGRPGFLSR